MKIGLHKEPCEACCIISFFRFSAAAAAATVGAFAAVAEASASEEDDKNENYPEAAIAVTIIEAHNYDLSPHMGFFFQNLSLCAVQKMVLPCLR